MSRVVFKIENNLKSAVAYYIKNISESRAVN